MKTHTRILAALAAGSFVGGVARAIGPTSHFTVALVALQPIGIAFIRLITMVVVPLVIASLFTGIASLGDLRSLGRVGGRTLGYFLGTTVVAATIGVSLAVLSHVGAGATGVAIAGSVTLPAPPSLVQTLLAMVPQNPFAAAATADLLPLIIAVALFGAAATTLSDERRRPAVAFFQSINDLCMVVIRWLMLVAPLAVFILVAVAVAATGGVLLDALAMYAAICVAGMLIHGVLLVGLALKVGARARVGQFFRGTSDALLLAFSTASSAATLPLSISAATERLAVRPDIASFVLTSGATLDKNGAAVYKTITAIFLAHVYGVAITPGLCVTAVLAATAASFAGAGIPGSSLVTTLIVLNAIGLGPRAAEGIAFVAAIDGPLDMCRTTLNTTGNLIGALWISRSETRRASRFSLPAPNTDALHVAHAE